MNDLESRLRALAAAVAPSEGFADRVRTAVAHSRPPAPRRNRFVLPLSMAVVLAVLTAAAYLRPEPADTSVSPPPAAVESPAAGPPPQPNVFYSITPFAYINSKWGFIDATGTIVIPARYSRVGEFSEGLAPVKVGGGHSSGGVWGFIDRGGVEVIRPQFDWARSFHNGLAAVKVGEKWGFIDRAGKLVIPATFESAERFSDGLIAVKKNGLWGYIGPDGEYRVRPRFDLAFDFSEGFAAVREPNGGKAGFIDGTGAFIIVLDSKMSWPGSFHEGRAKIEVGGLEGFIDRSGKLVIEPKYGRVGVFKDGKARVTIRTKITVGDHSGRSASRSGTIDRDGRQLAPFKWDYDSGLTINPATGKLNAVEVDDKGVETVCEDIDYDRLKEQNGLYRVAVPQKMGTMTYHIYGFVDRTGRFVIPPVLEDVEDFHDGLGAFATGLDWKAVEEMGKRGGK